MRGIGRQGSNIKYGVVMYVVYFICVLCSGDYGEDRDQVDQL